MHAQTSANVSIVTHSSRLAQTAEKLVGMITLRIIALSPNRLRISGQPVRKTHDLIPSVSVRHEPAL